MNPSDDKGQSPRTTSPYAEPCFKIILQNGEIWTVHHSILRKSSVLSRLCDDSEDDTLDLSHISESVAHVVVHYLYTGTYGTLELQDQSLREGKIAKFKACLGVYAISRALELPGLQAKARATIECSSDSLSATDRLKTARNAYPDPVEDDTWFLGYLKDCVGSFLQTSPGSQAWKLVEFLDLPCKFDQLVFGSAFEIASESMIGLTQPALATSQPDRTEDLSFVSIPTCTSREDQENEGSDGFEQITASGLEGSTQVETVELETGDGANDKASATSSPILVDGNTTPTEDPYAPTSIDIEVFEMLYTTLEVSGSSTLIGTRSRDLPSPTSPKSEQTGQPALPSQLILALPSSSMNPEERSTPPKTLEASLGTIWPVVPFALLRAPFVVAWEVLRVLLHCSIDPGQFILPYNDTWKNQDRCWDVLKSHSLLTGKVLPEKSDPQAWHDGIYGDFKTGVSTVVFVAEVHVTESKIGLVLHRLKREKSCRLYRQFGSDRFLQLLVPSIRSWKLASSEKSDAEKTFLRWLTSTTHTLAGRQWSVFWSKGEKRRSKSKRRSGSGQGQMFVNRIHLFAEDGHGFVDGTASSPLPLGIEPPSSRTRLTRDAMLDWLLRIRENASQPCLKLFSRISLGQGLTKATPTIVLDEHQIFLLPDDLESHTTGEAMNDGIGLISKSLMRKIRDMLSLKSTTCAIQARIGGAKGMWIVTPDDRHEHIEDWIEIYHSQMKWSCNWDDEHHRTLEVKGWSTELKPANLNTQFLPILDDRSIDKTRLRNVIKQRIADELERDIDALKLALKDPAQMRKWLHALSARQADRPRDTPFLGGLPDVDAERLSFLVDGGFDPMQQMYLSELVYELQMEKCEKLKTDLKIRLPRSTSAYMVVDFLGVLKPDEIHLAFSTPFGHDGDLDLDGVDVLVARNPAHLPSDIQKVRAVFKPELRHLKDVVVFSSEGDIPLARKLSGGDYDGDRAWVCWDPDIVDGFENYPTSIDDILPSKEVLTSFYDRNTTLTEDLVSLHTNTTLDLTSFIEESLAFSLRKSLLGVCTKYKETFCHARNSISDKPALLLSWLLAQLADEAKTGVVFAEAHWGRFKAEMVGERGRETKGHINDDLRSAVESTVGNALAGLRRFMVTDGTDSGSEEGVYLFDADIAWYWNHFENLAAENNATWFPALRQGLKDDLEACLGEWGRLTCSNTDYRTGVSVVHEMWRGIQPRADAGFGNDVAAALQSGFLAPEFGHWELLKASMTFKRFHKFATKFVWRIAGRQLQFIKALGAGSCSKECRVCGNRAVDGGAECRRLAVPVQPHVYEALKPDNKFIGRLGAGEASDWEDDGGE
ncbi:hypothetical protein OQA88_9342 [Cercophora sp. LCS_1]